MYLIIAFMTVMNLSPVCILDNNYDIENQTCVMSEEDVQELDRLLWAEGRVYGKKTNFLLKKIPFENEDGRQQWLRAGEVQQSFMELARAAKTAGFKIKVNSAYRTYQHQKRLWQDMPGIAGNPYNAGPRSHQTGYSVDFSGTYAFVSFKNVRVEWFSEKWCRPVENGFKCPTKFYWWLRKNAPKFGFYHTVKDEPWHLKFLGIEKGKKLVR